MMAAMQTEGHDEMKFTPLVSVVMPAYNAERFIEEAISSVQAQTIKDWELIIIDDCSVDSTIEVVEGIKASDPRIVLLCNDSNLGVAKTRNRGIDFACGQYVALLDSDDVWQPRKLEIQLAAAFDSGADIVTCSYDLIDEKGDFKSGPYIVPEETSLDVLLKENTIGCSTALLFGEVARQYRFNPDYYHEDYVLWLQMLQDGHSVFGCREVLASYRCSQGSRSFNKWKSALNRWVIYRNYLGLSLARSTRYFMCYTAYGLKKYLI